MHSARTGPVVAAVLLTSAVLIVTSVGCGDSDSAALDASPPVMDATQPLDTGAGDAPQRDAGSPQDSGGENDGGNEVDAGDTRPPARNRLAYVLSRNDRLLAVVELRADGTMRRRTGLDLSLPNAPNVMVRAQRSNRIYIQMSRRIATVTLAPDGRPSLLGLTDNDGNAAYISLVRNESILMTAHLTTDVLRSYDVSGDPPHAFVDDIDTADEPHSATPGPDDDSVYVPHRAGDTIHWYDVAANGQISLAGSVATPDGVGSRHLAFSADFTQAWVTNEASGGVTTYPAQPSGDLSAATSTVSTTPVGEKGSAKELHLTPDERHLYVTNNNHHSLASFSVGEEGALTLLGNVTTEEQPRTFNMSPDGRFLIVASQTSGFVESFAIELDGTTTRVDRLEIGINMRWVLIE